MISLSQSDVPSRNHSDFRIVSDEFGLNQEFIGGPQVIMIQESKPDAIGGSRTIISCRCYTEVVLLDYSDVSLIAEPVAGPVARPIIYDDDFKVAEDLAPYGLQRLLQQVQAVERRDDHANERRALIFHEHFGRCKKIRYQEW